MDTLSKNDPKPKPGYSDELAETRTDLAEERTAMAEERTAMANERTLWAQERTEGAFQRTLLANERTFAAWLGRALTAIAGGFAVAEFVRGDVKSILAKVIGLILILMGAIMSFMALNRYNQTVYMLRERGIPIKGRWLADVLVGGLVVSIILILLMIFA